MKYETPVKLNGILGKALLRSVHRRLKKVDYEELVSPFRYRYDKDGGWRGEFWGKIVRSALLSNYYVQDGDLTVLLRKTVQELLKTQEPSGCISSYPKDFQLSKWDVWGRKYVLLALIRYYDLVESDPQIARCCAAMVDHLMSQIGPETGKRSITACGEHGGLAASSILGAIVGTYRITGEKRFLDFANYIADCGFSQKHKLQDAILAGVTPRNLGNGKAYEMTSCMQGLCDLLAYNHQNTWKDAAECYYKMVHDHEILVTGSAGVGDVWGEYWGDGSLRQLCPGPHEGLGETCVAVTWLRYITRLMRMGSTIPCLADEAERILYNSILGAMAPDGSHWAHRNPTPLTGGGFRAWNEDQIQQGFRAPFGGNDCCRAQGPEGLALAPWFAVQSTAEAETLNFYEPMSTQRFEIEGNYPVESEAIIRITTDDSFVLRLRVPDFIKSVSVCGKMEKWKSGEYLELKRDWKKGDTIRLNFDFSIREIPAPCGAAYRAFKRGPIILAEDSRGEVPGALIVLRHEGRTLVDYASAGNLYTHDNTLTVWFPSSFGEKCVLSKK